MPSVRIAWVLFWNVKIVAKFQNCKIAKLQIKAFNVYYDLESAWSKVTVDPSTATIEGNTVTKIVLILVTDGKVWVYYK